MSKDKDKKERDSHGGSTAAEDSELTLWLNKQWLRNETLESIEVWQMFGQNKSVRGERIHFENFKPGEKLDIEQANKLANEIMEAVQHDCDAARRVSHYQITIIDHNRKAGPLLVRKVGPISPKPTYAMATLHDLENEDGPQDARSIELAYVKDGHDAVKWDKQRYDTVMGDMLMLMGSIIKDLREENKSLHDRNMSLFDRTQEAEERRVHRDILLEKEKFNLSLAEDAKHAVINLLPGLFPSKTPAVTANGNGNGNGNGHSNGNGNGNGAHSKDHGTSAERTLAGNFLRFVERKAELELALFGNFEERDGKMVQVKAGIFSFDQYRILRGVSDGRYPVTELDKLLPESGHALAITEEQAVNAMKAGVTEGIALALQEIMALRQKAQEARETVIEPEVVLDPQPTPA